MFPAAVHILGYVESMFEVDKVGCVNVGEHKGRSLTWLQTMGQCQYSVHS